MAATSNSIPLSQLCLNISTAATTRGVCLNENLSIVDGDRTKANHTRILEAVCRRLEEEPLPSRENPDILVSLRSFVIFYQQKMNFASSFGRKAGGQKIDPNLVEKIVSIIERIRASTRQVQIPSEVIPINPRTVDLNAPDQRMKIQQVLDGIVNDACIFRAALITANAIDTWINCREKLLSTGNQITSIASRELLSPSPEYFTLPGPLFLLECRLSRCINIGESHHKNKIQPLIEKILVARKRFPQHEKCLADLLVHAKWAESAEWIRRLPPTLIESISELQERSYQDALSDPMKRFVQEMTCHCEKIRAYGESRKKKMSQKFSSLEEMWAVHKQFAADEVTLKKELSCLCKSSATSYKESKCFFAAYDSFYSLISDYVQKTKKTQKKHKKEEELLRFNPRFCTGIFRKDSFLNNLQLTELPTPQALRSMLENPPFMKSCIDTIVEEFARNTTTSISQVDQREFLPSELSHSFPAPKQPLSRASSSKTRREKLLPETAALEKEFENLTISTKIPAPSPAVAQEDTLSSKETPPLPSHILPEPLSETSPIYDDTSSQYSFRKGSGPNMSYRYSKHVYRWFEPKDDPFIHDPIYRDKHHPISTQQSIRFRHTIGLAAIQVVLECGAKFVQKDSKGRVTRESYTLPADIQSNQKEGGFERGVITVARNPRSHAIFHVFFSLKAPSTMREEFIQNGYFLAEDDEEAVAVAPEFGGLTKPLPDDGSRITVIDDFGITVEDPKNKSTIDIYFK